MPSIKGVACSLTIDGHNGPASEYGTKREGSDYASAYVVAEGRKRFSLTVTGVEYVHPSLDVGIWIDGKYQDGRIMDELSENNSEFLERFTGKEEKQGRKLFKRLWKFEVLDVVGEGTTDCENERDVLLNLGTIEIVILRCNDSRPSRPEDGDDESPESPDVQPHPRAKAYWGNWEADRNRQKKGRGVKPTNDSTKKPVHETQIKGRDIHHRVITEEGFGIHRRGREKTIEYLDSFENPYCILVLKYRSHAALQNMDLIERTPPATPTSIHSSPPLPPPSPSPLPSPSPPSPDTDEERRLESLSEEQIFRELLMSEQSAKTAHTAPKIKPEREQGGRAKKRAKV